MNRFVDTLVVTPTNTRYSVLQSASLPKENDLGTMWTTPWR